MNGDVWYFTFFLSFDLVASIIQPTKHEQPSATSSISNPSTTTTTTSIPITEKPTEKPVVPGNTIRCIEDPKFTADINSPLPPTTTRPQSSTTKNEVVEEARDRFDRYWSKPDTETTKDIAK